MIKIFTKQNQKGMSAILLAMFFIVVISLITLGFSTLARHDQRAALDKTLSNQASYAAESGINAAKSYLETQPIPSGNDSCNPSPLTITGFNKPNLDPAAEVTCLKWAEGANSVTVDLNKGTPVWIPFESASSSIASVTVKWSTNNSVFSGCDSNTINSITDDTFPVLRVIASNTNMSSSNVNYLCPPAGGALSANGASDGGIVFASSCAATTKTCTATINSPVNGLLALVQLNGNLKTTATLTGYTGLNGSGEEVTFTGIYTIDSTAKSQDVIKRVKATYAKGGTGFYTPGQFAVNSNGDLCKNFKVDGSSNNYPGPISSDKCPNL